MECATTDGMMNGVPYVMYDAEYYHELYEIGDFFENDHDALMLLNTYLDDLNIGMKKNNISTRLDCIRETCIQRQDARNVRVY